MISRAIMLPGSFLFCLLFICYISSFHFYSWDITHSLDGDVMPPIAACPDMRSSDLRPENIHIIISLTEGLVSKYSNYTETVSYYSAMHGYHFRLVDPTSLLLKFGGEFKQHFQPMISAQAVLNLKSLISLCKFLLLQIKAKRHACTNCQPSHLFIYIFRLYA